MIVKAFDEKALAGQLRTVPPLHRVVFASSCATRLSRAYRTFHAKTGLGDPEVIREALKLLWEWTRGERHERARYERQLASVMEVMPEEGDSSAPEFPYAEDAASSVAYALRTLLSEDPREPAWSARVVYEALDQYVIRLRGVDVNARDAERRIIAEPLIQVELDRQQRDVDELQKLAASNSAVPVEAFRSRAEVEHAIPE